jgi:hypothetical protein
MHSRALKNRVNVSLECSVQYKKKKRKKKEEQNIKTGPSSFFLFPVNIVEETDIDRMKKKKDGNKWAVIFSTLCYCREKVSKIKRKEKT